MSFKKLIFGVIAVCILIVCARFVFLYVVNKDAIFDTCTACFSIEKRQYQIVDHGASMFGHNFIAIKDPEGNVIHEFHGFATRLADGSIDGMGVDESSQLKFWHYNGRKSHLYIEGQPTALVYKGSEQVVQDKVAEIIKCGTQINAKAIDYPYLGITWLRTGFNSNSMAHTLLSCVGVSSPHLGIFTPGEWRNILD